MKEHTMKTSFAILLACFLVACGGGGSDNSGTNGNTPEHPTESPCPCFPAVPASAPTE
jgi:hypothetical protein